MIEGRTTPHLMGRLFILVNTDARRKPANGRTKLHITSISVIPEVAYVVPGKEKRFN
jgi:hypothetical protein